MKAKEDFKWHRHKDEAPQRAGYVLVAIKRYDGKWNYYAAEWEMPGDYHSDGAYHVGCEILDFRSNNVYWKYIEEPEETDE